MNIRYEAERRTNFRIQEKNPSEKTHRTSGRCLGFSITFGSTSLRISQLIDIISRHDPDDYPATRSDAHTTMSCTYKRSLQARSRNHCYSGKAMSIKWCVCACGACVRARACVATAIQHAKYLQRITLPFVACPASPCVYTLSQKRKHF